MTKPAPIATTGAAPSLADDIARCVHCGFCLQACPTYVQLGMETDSPRGRIALIEAVASGRAEPTPSLVEHLDLCLQCRACESACPSGVAFGRIMETARAEIVERKPPLAWRLRAAVLRQTLAHPRRLAAMFRAMHVYQRSPVRALAAGSLKLVPPLARLESSAPRVPERGFTMPPQPPGLSKSVALLSGCVMPYLYPRTHRATVRVLNRLGYRVITPEAQTCCGALSVHAGDRRYARELARRNVDAFLDSHAESVIVNSAGCGSTMKEYAELLADDPAYASRAARLAGLTYDVLEFIAREPLPPMRLDPTVVVTYQDSCHLVHAQKVTRAPRQLLRAIDGLELREMAAPDRCCGSAGIYSIVQSAMSRRLLGAKMDDVAETGAEVIATANPGCMLQLEAGVRSRGEGREVVHVIELLERAMAEAAEPGDPSQT